MTATIALVDFGAGNLTSVRKAFAAAGATVFTPATPRELDQAAGIVIPGVGHFAATAALDAAWRYAIANAVQSQRPLLGICLGMQWLFEGSDEAPDLRGLGLFEGVCSRLPAGRKVPHVGWNTVEVAGPTRLLAGIRSGAHAYFAHSYAAPAGDGCVAATSYGIRFASVVERGSVFGVQFHPEKSSAAGLRLLSNFAGVCARAPVAG